MTDRARDFQQALLGQIIKAYQLGPDEDGQARLTWPDGHIIAEGMTGDFTPADLIAGIGFLTVVITGLAFEVDDAQSEGRPVDVAAVLDRYAMCLILARQAGIPAVPPEGPLQSAPAAQCTPILDEQARISQEADVLADAIDERKRAIATARMALRAFDRGLAGLRRRGAPAAEIAGLKMQRSEAAAEIERTVARKAELEARLAVLRPPEGT